MIDFLRDMFLSDEFMPHGHCFLWKPGLLWLHVASDGLIGTAYVAISVTLWQLVKKIRIPFSPMILAFGMFIGVCGLTHYMEILTLWVPDYWLSGAVKAVTAAASVATGAYLFRARSTIIGVAQAAELAECRRLELAAAQAIIEHAAQRHRRAFQVLSECSDALVRAADETTLLDAVCRIFVGVGGYRMCWVGLAEHDDRKTVRPTAHAGHEDGYLAQVDAVWSDTPHGRGPSGTAIRTGKAVIVHDIRSAGDFDAWRDEALRRGYASLVALPLAAGGAMLGVLRIYADRIDAFDEEELRLLTKVADDLAYGIAALRGRAERTQMNAQLMQSDRMASVGILAAGVAHEINNPLAYLIASLEFLDTEMRKALPVSRREEVEQALAEAREGASRVKHVVRDLKTFSRGDDARRSLVELRDVIEPSINVAYNEIKYRARLVKDYGDTPPVLANVARLGQVFLNLLINAAHAIPEGSVETNEIRLVTRTDDAGRAVIEVRDSGSGIAPDIRDRIFDPFFTTKAIGVGTGLGLSICRNIVFDLGGEISVDSEVGRGTVFRVVLPAAPEEADVVAAPLAATGAPARRGRVLVVDDEPAIGAALRRILKPEHDVTVLTAAGEARDLIGRGERFDVILCDLMMPRMTGMELHAELARIDRDQAERMILLTGGAFTPTAQQFLDRVPNARIEKPFDAASLRVLVRSLVG
jgi:signal transduction histidine kinase/CheY-like chemotaxis protein